MFLIHRVLLVPKEIHVVKWRNILAAGGHLGLIRGITIGRVSLDYSILYRMFPKFGKHPNESTNGLMSIQYLSSMLWIDRTKWTTNWFQWMPVFCHLY